MLNRALKNLFQHSQFMKTKRWQCSIQYSYVLYVTGGTCFSHILIKFALKTDIKQCYHYHGYSATTPLGGWIYFDNCRVKRWIVYLDNMHKSMMFPKALCGVFPSKSCYLLPEYSYVSFILCLEKWSLNHFPIQGFIFTIRCVL